jgi:NAD(P)-dependent dehydrogenase (short-subunit alcohol dehydrogenase family)
MMISRAVTGGALPSGLRVMVSAGASGIGRAIAETFRAHGARVHLCDIDEEALVECRRALPDVGATKADVADEAQVARWFDEAQAALGGLDVLVNNAGIAGPTTPIEELAPADWRRTIDVNLNSVFYCTRLAVPLLKATTDGAIVNLSSVAGRLGFALRTPYAASKWAIIGVTRSLAKELGPHGIRVNAILPGVVEGARGERVIAARAAATGRPPDEIRAERLAHVALRRGVSEQDVANAALFLCSPAGRNINGISLSVDGYMETT